MRMLHAGLPAWLAACAVSVSASLAAQGAPAGIWSGIYTSLQAERGKALYDNACIRCHGADLTGTTAPPLTGERFMATWGGESVERLFAKIRDTMPPTFGTILNESENLAIVAYILQTGGYPAGSRELAAGRELANVRILRKGEEASVQNFSLVQTVGCLSRGAGNTWVLTRTAAPAVTGEDVPAPDAIAAAASQPLGGSTFLLLSVVPFEPETHVGQKVEARGLVYRDGEDARLTLTALTALGASCEG